MFRAVLAVIFGFKESSRQNLDQASEPRRRAAMKSVVVEEGVLIRTYFRSW